MASLRAIAKSKAVQEFTENLEKMRSSDWWKDIKRSKIVDYFNKYWLKIKEVFLLLKLMVWKVGDALRPSLNKFSELLIFAGQNQKINSSWYQCTGIKKVGIWKQKFFTLPAIYFFELKKNERVKIDNWTLQFLS